MAKITRVQTAFTGGELAPFMRGRKDTALYFLACETLRNVIVRPQGSALLRPGLRLIASIHATAGHPGVRLLDFVFNEAEKYIVALYHQGGKVFRDGDFALVATLTLPYLDTELADLDYVQVADTMLIAHPNHPLLQLVRDPGEAWSSADYVFECPPQTRFVRRQDGRIQITGSLTAGSDVGLHTVFGTDNNVFTNDQVGETWVLARARVTITGRTDARNATGNLVDDILATDLAKGQIVREDDWSQQADNATHGYFRSCAYFQERLWLGGTRDKPFTLWASRTGAPFDFQVVSTDDDQPMSVAIATGRLDPILHLVPGTGLGRGGLEVFSSGAEGYLPSDQNQAITPKTIAYVPQTTYGSRPVKPTRLAAETIFCQRDSGGLRQLTFAYLTQSYTADMLTVRAAHLVDDPVALTSVAGGLGIQADFLICLNRDGTGAVMTAEPTEQVRAWADFVSARCMVDAKAVRNRVYVATRDGAGGVEHWLEWLDPAARYDSQMDATAASPTTAWTGFGHLAGKVADLWADGYWRGPVTIAADGSFAVPAPGYSAVSVGLPVDVKVRPMPPELEQGSLLGRPVRPVRATTMALGSAALRVNGRPIADRPFDGADTTGPVAADGESRTWLRGWSKGGRAAVEITREGPFPFELLALAVDYGVGGGG